MERLKQQQAAALQVAEDRIRQATGKQEAVEAKAREAEKRLVELKAQEAKAKVNGDNLAKPRIMSYGGI